MVCGSFFERSIIEVDPHRTGKIEFDQIQIAEIFLETWGQAKPTSPECYDIAGALFAPTAIFVTIYPISSQAYSQMLYGLGPFCQRLYLIKTVKTSPINQDRKGITAEEAIRDRV